MNKQLILEQLSCLLEDENNTVAKLSNTTAFINEILEDINWVGFYFKEENELVLGPFQGKVACFRIDLDKGVCGNAFSSKSTIVVDNVHEFAGHIACDHDSQSEIVIPIFRNNEVIGVLDIDSPSTKRFDINDRDLLEAIVKIIEKKAV